MNIKTKKNYSEVYQILNLLGTEYINKLPKELYIMIKEKRDINYNPEYTEEIPLEKQNIDKKSIAIITLLHLNYWCKDETEKNEIRKILKDNEKKYQEMIRIKYNPENIFNKTNSEESKIENKSEVQTSMIEYKENLLQRIFIKLKKFLHIK